MLHLKKKFQIKKCTLELNNIPQTCNRSLFGIPTDDISLEPSSSEELAALNAAYAQNCIPACIDPVVQYYRCYFSNLIFGSRNYEMFLLNLQNGICGQDNGEYCYVKSARLNDALPDLETNCPELNNNQLLVCNATTPQSCYDDLSTYSSRLGCCAAGLYPDVQNCRVTFDLPCSSTTPSSTSTPTTTTTNSTSTTTSSSTSIPTTTTTNSTSTTTSSSTSIPTTTTTNSTSTTTSSSTSIPTTSPANGLYPFTALSVIAFVILGLLF